MGHQEEDHRPFCVRGNLCNFRIWRTFKGMQVVLVGILMFRGVGGVVGAWGGTGCRLDMGCKACPLGLTTLKLML